MGKDFMYDIEKEYINIENYSPFSYINEISEEYRTSPFLLPFVIRYSREIPVHPDTLKDIGTGEEEIVYTKKVYPTSSYRTVYEPNQNICYKLPVLRRITRSVRDLKTKELRRSELASELLSKVQFEGFYILPEKCYYAEEEIYNYIIRNMPEVDCYPWFYVIVSREFSSDFKLKCMSQIIKSWMFAASKGIFFESPHTQNILVDLQGNVHYRDLSDIRTWDDSVLRPTFAHKIIGIKEMVSVIFDRAMCNQNLDHLFRYNEELEGEGRQYIKNLIASEIEKYNIPFPNYSMDYNPNSPERIPVKVDLVEWRK